MSQGADPLIRVTVARADGDELEVFTRRQGQRIELLPITGRLPAYEVGERLSLRRPVADDAMYAEPVVVTRAHADSVAVELAGERRRHQQRAHVRVDTPQLRMVLSEVVDEGEDDPREMEVRVLDLSAGGARVEHEMPPMSRRSSWRARTSVTYDDGRELELDQVVEVRWTLAPDDWAGDAPDEPDDDGSDESGDTDGSDDDRRGAVEGRALAGVQFADMQPALEESVTRWVFQQQARMLRVRRQGG